MHTHTDDTEIGKTTKKHTYVHTHRKTNEHAETYIHACTNTYKNKSKLTNDIHTHMPAHMEKRNTTHIHTYIHAHIEQKQEKQTYVHMRKKQTHTCTH